jgi:hypothetical protein
VSAVDDFIDAVLSRRLDDRMRELCERAATTEPDEHEIAIIRQELLCLMHEKISRMRRAAVGAYLEGKFLDRQVHRA